MSVQPVVHSMINSIHTLKDHCGQNRDGNLKTKSLLCNCRTSTRPYLCCVSNYLHDLLSKSRFCLHTPIMIFGPSIYYVSKRTEWIQKMAAFADVQHCIYAQIVGGSAKVQKCADVIYGWSLFEIRQVVVSHKKLSDMEFWRITVCTYSLACLYPLEET